MPQSTPSNRGFQFGMGEIVLLFTASALALWAYDRTMIFEVSSKLPVESPWQAIRNVHGVTLLTLGLFCLMLVLKEMLLKGRFVWRRGKVFLCTFGISALVSIAGSFYVDFPPGIRIADIAALVPPVHLLGTFSRVLDVMIFQLAVFSVFIIAACRLHHGRWRFAFAVILLPTAIAFFVTFASRFFLHSIVTGAVQQNAFVGGALSASVLVQAANLIAAVVLLWCCFTDRYRGDWRHWFGVTLYQLDLFSFKFLELLASV